MSGAPTESRRFSGFGRRSGRAKQRWRLSRRAFLIGCGATGGALFLGWRFGLPALRLQMAATFAEGASFSTISAPPNAWFEISRDNVVTLHMPKVEMGQGIHTALGQIAAEELEIAWEQLRVVAANTRDGPIDPVGTTGSTSVSGLYQPLREAAATLRVMLLTAAAPQLGTRPEQLAAADGIVMVANDPDRALTYGEIVAGHEGEWEVPETVPELKAPADFKLIGRSLPRVDFHAKLTGRALYGLDMRREGMLYGAVAYPATVTGRLQRAAPGNAASLPGVVAVVAEADFAGVAAESRAQAEQALAALDLEWDEGQLLQTADVRAMVSVGEGSATVIQKAGAAAAELRAAPAARALLAEYRTPMAAHAQLEPQAALVDVRPDGVEAWVSTQLPGMVQEAIAAALDRPVDTVTVTPTFLGGGFGRKAGDDVAVEAARLSQASGRPVHVGWTRAKEFRAGYLRPPTHHVLRGALDESGRLRVLDHQQASADVAFGFVPGFLQFLSGADFGATRGARFAYDVPHLRAVAWRTPLPFATGWWRGLGLLANIFAIESFMDEMAHLAGQDPLAFRLAHLPDGAIGHRLRAALTRVAEMGEWGGTAPAGRARGLAVCVDAGTVVAQVAEVSLETGRPRVHRVSCVVDPGLPINPDGVAAQSQGAVVMGLGSALLEQIELKDGRIVATNFDRYPLLTMKETPQIDIDVVRSGDEPFGVGEPPIGPVAAAVANAIFRLTGTRLRQLPLRL